MRGLLPVLALAMAVATSSPSEGQGVCPGLDEVHQINGPALPVAIATDGELAITKDSLGVTTWDVSDPATPQRIGSLVGARGWNPTIARADFYLHPDGYAIDVSTLGIYDLRHPAHPDRSWEVPSPGPNTAFQGYSGDDPWKGLAIRDDVIAAVNAETGIWLLDLTEHPLTPWQAPPWPDLPTKIADVAFVGTHLVVLGWLGEVVVYDIVDQNAPDVVGTGSLGTPAAGWSVYGGDTVALAVAAPFVSDGSPREVVVVDLDDPSAPTAHDATSQLAWWTIGRIELDGDGGVAQAYDPAGGVGWRLNELDLSDPANPAITTHTSGGYWDIGLSDGFVVRTRSWGIEVLDRSAGFPELGSSPVEGDADDLDVAGTLGVVANGDAGLVIFDLTNPFAPVELSRIDIGGWADEVRITGATAVVLVKGMALVTVDITDPAQPQLSGALSFTGSATRTEHLGVDGNLAMVSFGSYGSESGFLIVDISDPSAPSLRSETIFAAPATNDTAAYLSGTVALASNRNNLLTFDVSGPVSVPLDSIEVFWLGEIYDTAVVDDIAFAATGYGLFAVDVSDPTHLVVAESDGSMLASLGAVGDGFLAALNTQNMSWLRDNNDPGSPAFFRTPEAVRWWEPGRIVGDAWIRPSGPFLDVNSLTCVPPEADFTWSGLGRRIQFNDLSRYGVSVHNWYFGDGIGNTGVTRYSIDHLYDQPGQYTVTLEVTGPGGTDSIAVVVEVGTRIFADDFETADTIGWDSLEPAPVD